jgi:GDPmannose 4,6-dehydratase
VKVLITGIAGQDGSILANLHLSQGHQVWGTVSPLSKRLLMEQKEVILCHFHGSAIGMRDLDEIAPDRIYHMAAKHFSSTATHAEAVTHKRDMYECHVVTTRNILNWQVKNPQTKSLFALSSQMYNPISKKTQISEKSICNPQNYYGHTKLEAMSLIRFYRENFGVMASGAILFNHTSTRSKADFLFPYLAQEISKVISRESDTIKVANAQGLVDICHAKEVCIGLMKHLELLQPRELVFSSGKLSKISTIVHSAMNLLEFKGNYKLESNTNLTTPTNYVYGNPSLAKELLGWQAKLTPSQILVELVKDALSK